MRSVASSWCLGRVREAEDSDARYNRRHCRYGIYLGTHANCLVEMRRSFAVVAMFGYHGSLHNVSFEDGYGWRFHDSW